MDFSCPICGSALLECGGSFVCDNAHSFDLARAGYVNLLPPSGKGTHGDNKKMVAARRDFLNTGHYLPLANRVLELALEYIKPHAKVIDIGSGEGYYTDKLEEALRLRDGESRISAFDISKEAVRLAAKNRRISYAVASAYKIPVANGKFDAATNLFSPLAEDEIHRILNTGGVFIQVFPAEEHLFGLKEKIYDTPYKNTPSAFALSGFKLIHSERLTYEMIIKSSSEIKALFMMTPYAYRTGSLGRERVLSLDEVKTNADFYICVFEKLTKENN